MRSSFRTMALFRRGLRAGGCELHERQRNPLGRDDHPSGSCPVGRLHVELRPGTRKSDDAKLFVLTLTARGEPPSPDAAGLLAFHDLGHEWIVRGFTDLTTERMHEEWGRYQ